MAKRKKTVKIVTDKCDDKCGKSFHQHCGQNGALYFLGFIGAAIYYISTATSFWMGVLGFLKAIVWPVFLVLKLLAL
jgi:hypothetical protein